MRSDGKAALEIARKAVELWARKGVALGREDVPFPEHFLRPCGVFVTLKRDGKLRGCTGCPYPSAPLIDNLLSSAVSACRDPRFSPLKAEELGRVEIEVSLLSEPEPLKRPWEDNIALGEDGLIVIDGSCAGLLLPQVATEYSMTKGEFLKALFLKAGLEAPSENARIYKFRAQIFTEPIFPKKKG